MAHRIEGNRLIIDLDPDSKILSSTGKTYLLASTHGYQEGEIEIDGRKERIGINYNITRKVPK